MPTYHVRMDTGEGPDEGEAMDFPDSRSACHDAQVAMAEIAREKIPGSQKAHFVVEIDDEDGTAVYRGEMDFKGREGGSTPPSGDVASQLPNGPRE